MTRPRRRAAAILVTAAVLAGTSVADAQPAPTANVSARTLFGQRLGADPTLQAGEVVIIGVSGFATASVVAVDRPDSQPFTLRAGPRGTVDLVYLVPRSLPDGQYVISFRAVSVAHPRVSVTASFGATVSDDGDPAHIGVGVPPIGVFPFILGRAHPSSPPASSPPASHSLDATSAVAATTMAVGGTAYTGADILDPLLIGLIAIAAGAVIVLAARRRRGRHVGA